MIATGKEAIRAMARDAGFSTVRFLAWGTASMLVAALPYGNRLEAGEPDELPAWAGRIAPFARRNYYREAVTRLKRLSVEFRSRPDRGLGGKKSDFRIFCNSPVPEKPLADASGVGVLGRNGLIITAEAGSLVILAAMTLPYPLEGDPPLDTGGAAFPWCAACAGGNAVPQALPCVRACPTGALRGDGTLDKERCIQWYASGNGETIPPGVARRWENRLYGCGACLTACIHNRRPLNGVETACGALPAALDCRKLLSLDDGKIRALFKGSALDRSWLSPDVIRRNARMVLLLPHGDPDTVR